MYNNMSRVLKAQYQDVNLITKNSHLSIFTILYDQSFLIAKIVLIL